MSLPLKECSLVKEHLPSLHEALGSSLSTEKQNKTKHKNPQDCAVNPSDPKVFYLTQVICWKSRVLITKLKIQNI
jgi:hypothetical protein